MIVAFFGFDIPQNQKIKFQININIKNKKMFWKVALNLKQPDKWKTV